MICPTWNAWVDCCWGWKYELFVRGVVTPWLEEFEDGVSGLNDVDGNVGVGIVGAKADGVGGGSDASLPKYSEPMLGNLCANSGITRLARLSRRPVS